MHDATGPAAYWVLVAPAVRPEDEQGRPDLYLNTEGGDDPRLWEWEEESWRASPFTDAAKAALDLRVFDGEVEWRRRNDRRRQMAQPVPSRPP